MDTGHPSEDYRGRFAVIYLKDASESYILTRKIARDLSNEIVQVTIYTAINRQRVVFLWPADFRLRMVVSTRGIHRRTKRPNWP